MFNESPYDLRKCIHLWNGGLLGSVGKHYVQWNSVCKLPIAELFCSVFTGASIKSTTWPVAGMYNEHRWRQLICEVHGGVQHISQSIPHSQCGSDDICLPSDQARCPKPFQSYVMGSVIRYDDMGTGREWNFRTINSTCSPFLILSRHWRQQSYIPFIGISW